MAHVPTRELTVLSGQGHSEANKEAKPLDWSVQNKDGNTPLHVALIKRKFKVAEWLVKQQPELVGVTNNDGNTPLHAAAALGDAKIFKVLLDESIQWQAWRLKNKEGNTPLHVAIINYNWDEIPKLLLEKYPELARVTNYSKETPLHLAIIKFPPFGRKALKLEDKNNPRRISMKPSLENAAKNGDIGFLKQLRALEIEHGNYFVGQNLSGDNILHIAIRSEQYEFIEQVTKKLLPRSIIDKLINQRNNNGDTLFHVAAEVGNERIFKLLLEIQMATHPYWLYISMVTNT
ncbi:alpha-latroinsectotoxin-Lt1a-like [Chenopodium quinoa]|uniref:alpha-latroinsectotoxin-Lt1a-like n=1 Tax=Chenopodium quinoa TaxID=63459 RepID=UPI000B77D91A|nr:alpha-latroinsectotoxin-Lt1a-like [Chenopodium quinoa]